MIYKRKNVKFCVIPLFCGYIFLSAKIFEWDDGLTGTVIRFIQKKDLWGNKCQQHSRFTGGIISLQEIPFQHVWSGTQNGLHCSFALEHTDRGQHHLGCHIHVFQKALLASRQVLQISCNLDEVRCHFYCLDVRDRQAGKSIYVKAFLDRNLSVIKLQINSEWTVTVALWLWSWYFFILERIKKTNTLIGSKMWFFKSVHWIE